MMKEKKKEARRTRKTHQTPTPNKENKDEAKESRWRKVLPYFSVRLGMFYKPRGKNSDDVHLTNFVARIIQDIAEDDGTDDITHSLEIEAWAKGRTERIAVSATEFSSMRWVLERLGPKFVIHAGSSIRDHTRAAIQHLSYDAKRKIVYTHTGWRLINEEWAYLHGGGAIGAAGAIPGIEVKLPQALTPFVLPDPPGTKELATAVRVSLGLLDLAPESIAIPLLCCVYRSALGTCDFSAHLAGPTGAFKSELAALYQQHFGLGFDRVHLPGSWSSTGNALEGLAFCAKDALFVIDDYAPGGSTIDRQRYGREADRVLRAQGNNAGRQRMRADTTLRQPKPPRGLIASTGEEIPSGQSLRARSLIMELEPGAIESGRLSAAQANGAAGLYAQSMSGFLRWLAPQFQEIRNSMRGTIQRHQNGAVGSEQHRRTPRIVAELFLAWRLLLRFAVDVRAISAMEMKSLTVRGWEALGEAAEAQKKFQTASEPTSRYLELLRAALLSGHAYVESYYGGSPRYAEMLGWRPHTFYLQGEAQIEMRPQGHRIGYIDFDTNSLFLDPDASFQVAQRLASGSSGIESIPVSSKTLHKRLAEKRLLESVEESRGTLTVRKTISGVRVDVLHLRADVLGAFNDEQEDTAGDETSSSE